jgi:acetolactate synthase-1/3 small subunit
MAKNRVLGITFFIFSLLISANLFTSVSLCDTVTDIMSDRYVLSALVQNHAGVLSRVSGLFSRRGYNIDSLTVGETQESGVSRMTIVVRGDEATIEQIQKQLEKLVEVGAVRRLESSKAVYRELALIKVSASHQNRSDILQIANVFRARIVDVSSEVLTVEVTGDQEKIDGLIELLAPYGIRELARTGIAALERGPVQLSLIS